MSSFFLVFVNLESTKLCFMVFLDYKMQTSLSMYKWLS